MSSVEERGASPANEEAIEAWDGPLFERFVQFREVLVGGLAEIGDEAMSVHPPPAGARILDLGCGFGDSTQQLAALVGPSGHALGVDASPRFIEAATAEAAGVDNAEFAVADIETAAFEGPFSYVFSRFGVMFLANPVAGLRNVRAAMTPGGKLVLVVWRAKVENDWVWRAQQTVERFVTKPENYDDPTCGPGPFAMANADTTSGQLVAAGFEQITLRRCDLPILIGRDLEEAVDLVMSIGPAGEIIRLQGDRATHLHTPIREALLEELAPWQTPNGVVAPASTWIVSAVSPV